MKICFEYFFLVVAVIFFRGDQMQMREFGRKFFLFSSNKQTNKQSQTCAHMVLTVAWPQTGRVAWRVFCQSCSNWGLRGKAVQRLHRRDMLSSADSLSEGTARRGLSRSVVGHSSVQSDRNVSLPLTGQQSNPGGSGRLMGVQTVSN